MEIASQIKNDETELEREAEENDTESGTEVPIACIDDVESRLDKQDSITEVAIPENTSRVPTPRAGPHEITSDPAEYNAPPQEEQSSSSLRRRLSASLHVFRRRQRQTVQIDQTEIKEAIKKLEPIFKRRIFIDQLKSRWYLFALPFVAIIGLAILISALVLPMLSKDSWMIERFPPPDPIKASWYASRVKGKSLTHIGSQSIPRAVCACTASLCMSVTMGYIPCWCQLRYAPRCCNVRVYSAGVELLSMAQTWGDNETNTWTINTLAPSIQMVYESAHVAVDHVTVESITIPSKASKKRSVASSETVVVNHVVHIAGNESTHGKLSDVVRAIRKILVDSSEWKVDPGRLAFSQGAVAARSASARGFLSLKTPPLDMGEERLPLGIEIQSGRENCNHLHVPEHASLGPSKCTWFLVDQGTTCTFTCDDGYEMLGPADRICFNTGEWSVAKTTCRARCQKLTPLVNGRQFPLECFMDMPSDKDLTGVACTHTCNVGYGLIGEPKRVCRDDGTWSESPPVCRRICTYLAVPNGGHMVCPREWAFEGDTCTFSCVSPLVLQGESSTTCDSDGSWTAQVPTCILNCKTPPPIFNSDVEPTACASPTYEGIACTYTCHTGYRNPGPDTKLCDADGLWQPPTTNCLKTCPKLESPGRGTIQPTSCESTDPLAGDKCSIMCDVGHQLSGDGDLTCTENGQWDRRVPKCDPMCPILTAPPDSTLQCTGHVENDTCALHCAAPYRVRRSSFVICQNDGSWSEAIGECIITCPKLTAPARGGISPTECTLSENFYEVTCTYSCEISYVFSGFPKAITRTCGSDGIWTGGPVTCVQYQQYLIVQKQGDIDVCIGRSEDGNIDKFNRNECDQSDTAYLWSLRDGQIMNSRSGKCLGFSSSEPLSHLQLLPCAGWGRDTTWEGPVNARANYTIRHRKSQLYIWYGYMTSPRLLSTASSTPDTHWLFYDGKLSRSVSYFGAVNNGKCPPLPMLPNGNWLPAVCLAAEVSQGTRCSFLCVPGYEVTKADESSTECDHGIWSGDSIPSCSKSCHDHHYENIGYSCSVAMLSSNTLGSMCSFSCPNGQVLIGEPHRVCFDDGDWSAPLPVCGWECPPYQPPTHSTADVTSSCKDISTSHKPGDVCKIACDDGYVPDSSPYLLCRHDGTWNNTELACIRSCHPPPSLVHGTVMCNNTGLTHPTGTLCTYTCDGVRILEPSTSWHTQCLDSGVWSTTLPACQNPCPSISNLLHGDVIPSLCLGPAAIPNGQVCRVMCHPGYTLSSHVSLSCLSTGQWSDPIPTCEPDVHFIMKSGSWCVVVVHYRSFHIFKVEKLSLPYCNQLDPYHKWSRTSAGHIRHVATGWCLTADAHNNILVTDCHSSEQAQLWECQIIRGDSQIVSGVKMKDRDLFLNSGSELSPTVQIGELDDDHLSKYAWQAVNLDGTSGSVCGMALPEVGQCPTILPSTHSTVYPLDCHSSAPINASCTTICESGFELMSGQSSATIHCQVNGEWSSTDTVCKKLKCTALPSPSNGVITNPVCTSANTSAWSSTECKYSCNPDSTPDSDFVSLTLLCLGAGIWSETEPRCVQYCPALSLPASGVVSPQQCLQDKGSKHGDTCTFTCLPYFELSGTSVLSCQSGSWSASTPTCQDRGNVQPCPPLDPPNFSWLSVDCTMQPVAFGTECQTNCIFGLRSDPTVPQKTYCHGAAWTNPLPQCKKECPRVVAPEHSYLQPSRCSDGWNVEGNECTVICHHAYALVGGGTLTCQPNGVWHPLPPTCKRSAQFMIRAYFQPALAADKCVSSHSVDDVISKPCNVSDGSQQWEWAGSNIRNIATLTCLVPESFFSYSFLQLQPCENILKNWACSYSTSIYAEFTIEKLNMAMARNDQVKRVMVVNKKEEESDWYQNRTTVFFATNLTHLGTPCAFRATAVCAELPTIRNGYVEAGCQIVANVVVGKECSYFCDSGYKMVGTASRICEQHGVWSVTTIPSCVAQCSPLVLAETIKVEPQACTEQKSVEGQICNFACSADSEFALFGSTKRVCESTASWSGVQSICQKGCTALSLTSFMFVSPVPCSEIEQTAGKICTLSCSSGYILKGPSVKSCLSSGEWSGEASACKRSCPGLPIPFFGRILPFDCLGNGKSVGDDCIHSCNPGYSVVGSQILSCKSDGLWSNRPPECAIVCQPLPEPTNGRLICPNVIHKAGDVCELKCDVNYVVDGQDTSRKCLNTAQWSGKPSTCARQLQFILFQSAPPNAPICLYAPKSDAPEPIPSTKEFSTCTFQDPSNLWSWHQKHLLRNAMLRMCLAGSYAFKPPHLRLVECDENDEDQLWECADPKRTWFIRLTATKMYPVFSILSSTKVLLYTDKSLDFIRNQNLGITLHVQWYANSTSNVRTSVCAAREEETCPALLVSSGVYVSPQYCTSQAIQTGGECHFGCPPQKQLLPPTPKVICLKTGLWSNPAPECKATCAALVGNMTDRLSVSPNQCKLAAITGGKSCVFLCPAGMRLVGQARLTCKSNLEWNFKVPKCEATCPALNLLEHGAVEPDKCTSPGSQLAEGTVCSYSCLQSGFVLAPEGSRTCTGEGKWTGRKPYCVKPCPIHEPPKGGTVLPPECSETTSMKDMVCAFSCHSGLVQTGSHHRVCFGNGSWSGVRPNCQSTCPPIEYTPENGILKPARCGNVKSVVSQTCTLLCEPGYKVSGNAAATCLDNGLWSSLGTCVRGCSAFYLPYMGAVLPSKCVSGGLSVGDICRFECFPEHTIDGSSLRTCRADGTWTGSPAHCIKTCTAINADKSVTYSPSLCGIVRQKPGTNCTAKCASNMKSSSGATEDTVQCLADGAWDKEPVTNCFPGCPPRSIKHGKLVCDEDIPRRIHYEIGTECKVRCIEDYVPDGDPNFYCAPSSGGAVWSSPLTECRYQPDPMIIVSRVGFRALCFGERHGRVVLIEWEKCGDEEQSTFWIWHRNFQLKSAKSGYCISVSDPEPNLFLGMEECSDGDPMQQWDCDPQQPYCIRLKGTDLSIDTKYSNLNGVILQRGMAPNSLLYTYNPETEKLTGTVCSRRSEYSCPRLQLTDYVHSIPTSCGTGAVKVGDVCGVWCNYSNLTSNVECLATGFWEPKISESCRPVCSRYKLTQPHAGFRDPLCALDKVPEHTVCEVVCSPGYLLKGEVKSTTCESDSWTPLGAYSCLKTCPSLGFVKNGKVEPSECLIESCTVQCNPGYRVQGPATRHCSESGHWSSVEFSCVPELQFRIANKILFKGQKLCLESLKSMSVIKAPCVTENKSQMWRWSSHYTLENVATSKCLALNTSSNIARTTAPGGRMTPGKNVSDDTFQLDKNEGSVIVTEECNATDPRQRWTCGSSYPLGTLRLKLNDFDQSLDSGPLSRSRLHVRSGTYKTMRWEGDHYTGSRTICGYRSTGVCQPVRQIYQGKVSPAACHSEFIVAGTRCKFTCNSGYSVEGIDFITCQSNGQWSNPSPVCLGMEKCLPLKLSPGLVVEPRECTTGLVNDGLLCQMHCTDEKLLYGAGEISCMAGGIWSAPLPKCDATCPALHHPRLGRVFPDSCELDNLPLETECNTTCDAGYTLTGDATRWCLPDGTWSGTDVVCKKVCPPIPLLGNGTISPEQCYTRPSDHAFTCTLSCTVRYALHGARTIQCADGEWDSDGQKCIPDWCDRFHQPQVVENIIYTGTKNGALVSSSVAQIICRSGYKTIGPTKKVCLPSGLWSGGNVTCEQTRCPHLNRLYHGTVAPEICTLTEPGVIPGTTCYFTCDEGYQLKGVVSVQCQDHGQWPDDIQVECQNVRATAYPTTFTIVLAVQFDSSKRCVESTSRSENCELHPCNDQNPHQLWRWYGSKLVQNLANQLCLVMSNNDVLTLAACDIEAERQAVQCGDIESPTSRLQIIIGGLYLSSQLRGMQYISFEELSWWTGYEVEFSPSRYIIAQSTNSHQTQLPICSFMCGGIFNTAEGDIATPNYPKPYPVNVHCQWIIYSPDEGQVKQVDFSKISLEASESANPLYGCPKDYVSVRSGALSKTSTSKVRLTCATENRFRIQSVHKAIHIDFHSNYANVESGFTVHWNTVQKPVRTTRCGGLTGPFNLHAGKYVTAAPWQAMVTYQARFACNAFIVSEKFVLTDYSCVHPFQDKVGTVSDEKVLVVYGFATQRELLSGIRENRFAETQHIFSDEKSHNLALVMMKAEIRFKAQVQPICIEYPGTGTQLVPDESECWALQWHSDMFTDIKTYWKFTYYAKLRVLSNTVCSERYRQYFLELTDEKRGNYLCAVHDTNSTNSLFPIGSTKQIHRNSINFMVQCRGHHAWYAAGMSSSLFGPEAMLVTRLFAHSRWIVGTMADADILLSESASYYANNG